MGIVKGNQQKSEKEKRPRGRPPKTRYITKIKAMDYVRKIEKLDLEGNVAENWRKFKTNFEIFAVAAEIDKKPDNVKIAVLLNTLGPDAVELYQSFNLTVDQKNSYKEVLQAFENYCEPKKNTVYESFLFHGRNQQKGEPFDAFYLDLKKIVKKCDFKEFEERMLRDRIVFGVADKKLQKRLLETQDLDLKKALDMSRAAEITEAQIKEMQADMKGVQIDEIRPGSSREPLVKYSFKNNKQKSNKINPNMKNFRSNQSQKLVNCKFCAARHEPRKCPAYGKNCLKCGKINHFAAACMQTKPKEVKQITKLNNDVSSYENFYIDKINCSNRKQNAWIEKIRIENYNFSFKLDTGAEVNILPYKYLKKISGVQYHKTKTTLEAYGGAKIHTMGEVELICETKNCISLQKFFIVNSNTVPILGLKACLDLNLIKKVDSITKSERDKFVQQYRECFEGLGKFVDNYNLELKNDAKPVVKSARRIPLKINDKVKETLQALCEKGIIEPVSGPSEWISNVVIIEKPSKDLRICLDPKYLNEAIKEEKYPIPSFEEIASKLNNKTCFSVLDLKDGYWQVALNERSSNLCAFSTPFGTYKFKRLPFGIKTAPEVFQKFNEANFKDIPGVVVYIDDILVAGETEEEHDKILKAVMKRALERKVKFNEKKLQYKVTKVRYLGHVIDKHGISIDADRVRAIKSIKESTNKKELQQCLGMINYLRKFIPNLAEMSQPLRELMKKNVVFQWLPNHTQCLNKIKQTIMEAPVLKIFDPDKEIVLQTDASKYGLGCCLLQQGQPVSFASRSLTDTEVNYAQIEKELLAIVFACQKYHQFIYGRNIKVMTDHKPLLGIFRKELGTVASPRLQRMKLRLLKYNIKLEYVPGKYLHIADFLSRNFEEHNVQEPEIEGLSDVIHTINVSDAKKKELKEAIDKDATLSALRKVIVEGWPARKSELEENLRYYWKLKNELYVDDRIIFLNNRIIVPSSLKREMLSRLHQSHQGIERTKAKSLLYWPNMNEDIENIVAKCDVCQKYRNASRRESLIPHHIPLSPFEKIAIDIMECENEIYLIIVDYYSKFPEVIPLANKTAKQVIQKLGPIFATHGIPKQIVADNMPFSSYQFIEFTKKFDIELITSSPLHPKSNGLAERTVQTIKKVMLKCKESKTEFWLALLELRNTPVKFLDKSPTELLMSRKTRSLIPGHEVFFQGKDREMMKTKFQQKQKAYKLYYDRGTKDKGEFRTGEVVWLRNGKTWVKATIQRKHNTPRSYMVKLNDGTVLRRNTSMLRKSK